MSNTIYATQVTDLFTWILHADRVQDDTTTHMLHLKGNGTGIIVSNQSGIIAGIAEICFLIEMLTGLRVKEHISDGMRVTEGTVLLRISGSNTDLLGFERSILNVLGRMSGIATQTHTLVSLVKNEHTFPCIAATRKTPYMLLDKKAVAVGGGLTHRLDLADWELIKDNHLSILKNELPKRPSDIVFSEAVKRAVKASIPFFEIEVETQQQAEAVQTVLEELSGNSRQTMAILLDNFSPYDAGQFIKQMRNSSVYTHVLIEASGGITQENFPEWSHTGVDILSLGSLTHSSQNFNLSMEIE